eukprot:scaffold98579_cov54-Attheya_sp.AAC.2
MRIIVSDEQFEDAPEDFICDDVCPPKISTLNSNEDVYPGDGPTGNTTDILQALPTIQLETTTKESTDTNRWTQHPMVQVVPQDDSHYVFHESPKNSQAASPLDALALACAVERDLGCIVDSEKNNLVDRQISSSRKTQDDVSSITEVYLNHSIQNSPMKTSMVASSFEITDSDVLCGRGGMTNHHAGNVFFRKLVRMKQETYLQASKREKASVARDIVSFIRNMNPPGRFLKKDGNSWKDIGDRKAREKTSQALREGAPDLRPDMPEELRKSCSDSVDLVASSVTLPRARIVSTDSIVPVPDSSYSSQDDICHDASKKRKGPFALNQNKVAKIDSHFSSGSFFYDQNDVAMSDSSNYSTINSTSNIGANTVTGGSSIEQLSIPSGDEQGPTKRGPRLMVLKARMTECI